MGLHGVRVSSSFILAVVLSIAIVSACDSKPLKSTLACAMNADCPPGEQCNDGSCMVVSTHDGGSDGGEPGSGGAGGDSAGIAPICVGQADTITTAMPCGCQDDCTAGEFCFTEAEFGEPLGSCLRSCQGDPCPEGRVCISGSSPGDETCYIACEEPADCPAGRICAGEEGSRICLAFCQSDSDCPVLGSCDRQTGICGNFGSHPGTGELGGPCQRDDDCISAHCRVPSATAPEGTCIAGCSVSKQGCPEGFVCIESTDGVQTLGDFGTCRRGCLGPEDCRVGYICTTERAPDGQGYCVGA